MFLELVTIGTFLVICLLVFLIGDTINGGRRTARSVADAQAGPRDDETSVNATEFKRALAGIIPQSSAEVDKIDRDLKRAGYYRSTALLEYMATRNLLIVAIAILCGFLAVLSDPATSLSRWILAGGALTACLGYGLPRVMLSWQAKRRVERIERGLPDALDIVRMCLAGGLPLRQALHRVSNEIGFLHPDIAVEFEVVRRHADADTMGHALKQFALRIGTPDVNALAAIVTQSERMGTHVSFAVSDYADSVRRVRRQRAEERANKTSIKMLFPVVLCLVPPIYILLCGPPILKLRNFIVEGHQPGGILEVPTEIGASGANTGNAAANADLTE